MFRFANPQYLWLLAALPVLAALFWLAMRNRRRRLARFGRPEVLDGLMPEVSNGRVVIKFRMKDSDMIDQMSAILEGSAQGE